MDNPESTGDIGHTRHRVKTNKTQHIYSLKIDITIEIHENKTETTVM
jgi:hypothetical protein